MNQEINPSIIFEEDIEPYLKFFAKTDQAIIVDKFKNNLTVVASHRQLITNLEKKNNIKNYKIYISKDINGHIVYNYKIIGGVSLQKIGIDLLKQNGYRSDIVSRAYSLVQHKV